MPEKHLRALSRFLWDNDQVSVRIAMAISEALWGVMLLIPGDTFDRQPYSVFKAIAPEELWGAAFIATAVVQIYLILENDFYSKRSRIFGWLNAVVHAFIVGAVMFSVTPPPAALAAEISLTIMAFWIAIRPYLFVIILGRAGHAFE